MTTETDIANRALSLIGTRSQIASLTEGSNESISANKWIETVRNDVLRMAPWNSATIFANLALICAAPGTPENPSAGTANWQRGQPPPPWAYEYAYPSDCLRALFIVPQFATGFASGIPITTAITGGAPSFWNGPPVRFKIGLDKLLNGVPSDLAGAADTKVVWTNQEFAILSYIKLVTDPNVMDDQLQNAWASALAARMAIDLTGDKALANLRIQDANQTIQVARAGDGNEGLTINNVTPDWIRIRGIDYPTDMSWSPALNFDWGALITAY